METNLRDRLKEYDGVHTATLENIGATLSDDPVILSELCDLALSDERKLQSASTWLLKRFSESGVYLDAEQSERLLQALMRESCWEARLHILQMMPTLVISPAAVEELWPRLTEMTGEANNLIRAWSLSGLAAIADKHRDYRIKSIDYLARGTQDKASSVRARIRRLRKMYHWLGTEEP